MNRKCEQKMSEFQEAYTPNFDSHLLRKVSVFSLITHIWGVINLIFADQAVFEPLGKATLKNPKF